MIEIPARISSLKSPSRLIEPSPTLASSSKKLFPPNLGISYTVMNSQKIAGWISSNIQFSKAAISRSRDRLDIPRTKISNIRLSSSKESSYFQKSPSASLSRMSSGVLKETSTPAEKLEPKMKPKNRTTPKKNGEPQIGPKKVTVFNRACFQKYGDGPTQETF